MSITIPNDYQRRAYGQLVDGEAGLDALALVLPSERIAVAGRETFARTNGEGLFVPQQRELYVADAVQEIVGEGRASVGYDYKVVEQRGVLAVRPMNSVDYALQIGSDIVQAAIEMIRTAPATVRQSVRALSEARLTPATAGYAAAGLLAAFAPAAYGQGNSADTSSDSDQGTGQPEPIIDVPVELGRVPREAGEQPNLLRLGLEVFAGGSGAGIEATVIPRLTLSYRNNQGAIFGAQGWQLQLLAGVPLSGDHVLNPDAWQSVLSDSFDDPFQAGNRDDIYHDTRSQQTLNPFGEASVEGSLIYNLSGALDATVGVMFGLVAADGSTQPWERYRLRSIVNRVTTEDIGDIVQAGDASTAPTIRPAYGLRGGLDWDGYRLGLEWRLQHDRLSVEDTFGIFGAYLGGTWDLEL